MDKEYARERLRRYAWIGRRFEELWRLGAPWPVRRDGPPMLPDPADEPFDIEEALDALAREG